MIKVSNTSPQVLSPTASDPIHKEVREARVTHDGTILPSLKHANDYDYNQLDDKIDALSATSGTSLSVLQGAVDNLDTRLDVAEPKITNLQSDMTAEKAKIVTLQADNTTNKANIATLQSGKADKLMATNLVSNGDFSNGATGFDTTLGTVVVENGRLKMTPNGTAAEQNTRWFKLDQSMRQNDKVYVRYSIELGTGYTQTSAKLREGFSGGLIDLPNTYFSSLPTGVTHTISSIATFPSNYTGIGLYIYGRCTQGATVPYYIDNVSVINLTATFGAGNEPTLAEMDLLMSQFSNSWFDGTQELLSLKGVQKELSTKADKFMATNLATNGDFSNGTTGWILYSGNPVVENGKMKIDLSAGGNIKQLVSGLANNKYYVSVKGRHDLGTGNMKLDFRDGSNNTQAVTYGLPSTSVESRHSVILTPPAAFTNVTIFYQATTGFYYLDDILVINLTQTFGAGNEPSLTEMDLLMSKFPNSWFDGTQELLSLKAIQKELSSKASIAQEAWITPTLTGGATGTARYMKDSLGFVWVSLDLATTPTNTTFITLPAGYRPDATRYFLLSANSTTQFSQVSITSAGAISQNTAQATVRGVIVYKGA